MPGELSGGQRKRVALARAIALDPEVILYDEPTTGLDPIRSDVINELILKLQRELKVTSIVVTHDMDSAFKVADRIVMLHEGKIIFDGTPDRDPARPRLPIVRRFVVGEAGDEELEALGESEDIPESRKKIPKGRARLHRSANWTMTNGTSRAGIGSLRCPYEFNSITKRRPGRHLLIVVAVLVAFGSARAKAADEAAYAPRQPLAKLT